MWGQIGCLPSTLGPSVTVDGSSLVVIGENEHVKAFGYFFFSLEEIVSITRRNISMKSCTSRSSLANMELSSATDHPLALKFPDHRRKETSCVK